MPRNDHNSQQSDKTVSIVVGVVVVIIVLVLIIMIPAVFFIVRKAKQSSAVITQGPRVLPGVHYHANTDSGRDNGNLRQGYENAILYSGTA